MNKTVLLRLEAPLQSWASQGRFALRDTEREPSKSGVLGLVGSALGMERGDDAMLATLAPLVMATRVDRPGTLLRDYHTAGGGTFRGAPNRLRGEKKTAPTERYYLEDASFLVALEGEASLIDKIAGALQKPKWPLFLGRRSCVPSKRIFAGVVELDAVSALRDAPRPDAPKRLRLVVESDATSGTPRNDVPISFRSGNARHGTRFVTSQWLDVSPESEAPTGEATP